MKILFDLLNKIFHFEYTYDYYIHEFMYIFESRKLRLNIFIAIIFFIISILFNEKLCSWGGFFTSWFLGYFIFALCFAIASTIYDIDLIGIMSKKDKEIHEAYINKYFENDRNENM